MGFPTNRHRKAADRLITRYGGTATLTQSQGLSTDEWGNPIPGEETEYPVRAIDTGSREAFGTTPGRDGGSRVGVIHVGDSGVTPALGNRLTIGGETIALTELEPVQPNPDQQELLFKYSGIVTR